MTTLPPGPSRVATTTSRSWLRRLNTVAQPWVRLVCLPHAGGNAGFFRPWRDRLAPDIELYGVQYPGRLDRIADPFVDDMDEVAEAVTAAVMPLSDRPIALFGHSLGAAVAYEVARRLQPRTGRSAVRLFLSGRSAPAHPGETYLADDDRLWGHVARLGGTLPQVVADGELRRASLPALRNDFRLSERYRPRSGPPLDCPVSVLLGDADTEVDHAQAHEWAAVTRAAFDLRLFAGDHFYLTPRLPELLAEIEDRLLESAPPRYGGWAGP